MEQPQLLPITLNKQDVVYTPDWVAADMVDFFKPSGRILEPCKGDGVFLKYLSTAEWCEIQEGRDFFAWDEHVDYIISNPPYSLFKEFLRHGISVANHVIYLVPLGIYFRAISIMKFAWKEGWIKHIRIYGSGGSLGFPMGNPVGAVYWERDYHGDTSWSWYAPDTVK